MEITQTQEQIDATAKLDAFWKGVEDKAEAIAVATKRKIVPIVVRDFSNPDAYVVGYMLRPDLTTQLRLIDRGQDFASGFSQEEASKVLQANLIVAESDGRINMVTEEGELYWKGALVVLYDFVKAAIPVFKKK